jgi:hypothetical protein
MLQPGLLCMPHLPPPQDPSDGGPDDVLPPSATAALSPRGFLETLAARLPPQAALATEATTYMAKASPHPPARAVPTQTSGGAWIVRCEALGAWSGGARSRPWWFRA